MRGEETHLLLTTFNDWRPLLAEGGWWFWRGTQALLVLCGLLTARDAWRWVRRRRRPPAGAFEVLPPAARDPAEVVDEPLALAAAGPAEVDHAGHRLRQ